MRQRRNRSRFALETTERVGVACELLRKNFQRHVSSEARVLGAVDLAHSAGSKGLDDAIGPKAGSWRERHGERSLAPVAQPVKTSGFRGGVDARTSAR